MNGISHKIRRWEVEYGQIWIGVSDYELAKGMFTGYIGKEEFNIETPYGIYRNRRFLHYEEKRVLRLSCSELFRMLNEGDMIYIEPYTTDTIRISVESSKSSDSVNQEEVLLEVPTDTEAAGEILCQPQLEGDSQVEEEPEHTHLRIQYLLVKIGVMEGYDVWVARNDKGKKYNSEKLADICLNELPHFAGPNVLRIAESIDVIWFRKNTARPMWFFEIEHTTSVYSGLLRLNDVRIDYPVPRASIVAEEARRSLFESQISRRTFNVSELNETCQFMNYQTVEQWYDKLEGIQEIRKDFSFM